MEVESPYSKFGKNKFSSISPIPKVFGVTNPPDTPYEQRFAGVQRRLFEQQSSTPCNGCRTPPSKDISSISGVALSPKVRYKYEKYKLSPNGLSGHVSRLNSSAPVNPFTPSGRAIVSANLKRKRSQRDVFREWLFISTSDESVTDTSSGVAFPECSDSDSKSILGPSLHDLEISRFSEEFKVEEFIASGSFGIVFKCSNYLDGIVYAVKKSAQQVVGSNYEQLARREVFAHAALRSHPHIVTYYSSWIEGGHLYIQTEYCNAGNLEQLINNRYHDFTEGRLKRLINHVSKGLKHIHSQNLAHMDIKPENILISRVEKHDTSDEDVDDDNEFDEDHQLIYKIGDLGHVMVVDKPFDVEDGDCRYMAKELLNENYDNLKKADIFAFGMTLYEAAGGGPLPKNGDEWQHLRSGNIPNLDKYSFFFNNLVKQMLHPEPEQRPTVNYVLQQTRITKSNLQRAIQSYKMKSDYYAQQVRSNRKCLERYLEASPVLVPRDSRIPKIVVDER